MYEQIGPFGIEELDKNMWWSEPSEMDLVNDEHTARMYYQAITKWLHRNDLSFPSDAKYLGLAVGQAVAEIQLAQFLKIPDEQIVFVDKRFRSKAKQNLAQHPSIRTTTSGIFMFLNETTERDFSLVTAFGIEYVLDEIRMPAFINLLPRVLQQGSLVCIFPSLIDREDIEDISARWIDNGFEPIMTFKSPYSPLMYSYGFDQEV